MPETSSVLYIGTVITDEIEQEYDIEYSIAGNNKRRIVVRALDRKHNVDILSPMFVNKRTFRYYGSNTYTDDDTADPIHAPPVLDIPVLNFVIVALTTALWAAMLVRRNEYDVIIFYNFSWKAVFPAYVCKLLFGLPIVIEYEDGLAFHDHPIMRWSARLFYLRQRYLDGAIAVNERLAGRLRTTNTAIVYGRPSVGMPDELPDPSSTTASRILMYAGAFDEIRGVFEFLSLAERLLAERDDITCWISGYGSDEMQERVRREVERFDDSDVEFFGTLPWDDYRTRLVSADVLVSPQDPEATISRYTFPSKLLDFITTGNHVVSTDIEGIDDHFKDKIIFGGTTSDSLKRAVSEVLDNPQQSADRIDFAVQWIERECTYDRISEKVERVVTNAAKSDP